MSQQQKFLMRPKFRRWLLDATIIETSALQKFLDSSVLVDFVTHNPQEDDVQITYVNRHKMMLVPVRLESHYIFGVGFETTNISQNLNQDEEIQNFKYIVDMNTNEMFFIRIYSNHNVMCCYTILRPGVVLLNFSTYAVENWNVKLLNRGSLDSRIINNSGSGSGSGSANSQLSPSDIPLLALKSSEEDHLDNFDLSKFDTIEPDGFPKKYLPTRFRSHFQQSSNFVSWKTWFKDFISLYQGDFNMATEVRDATGNIVVPADKIYRQHNGCRVQEQDWRDDFSNFIIKYYKFSPKVYTRGVTLMSEAYLDLGGLSSIQENPLGEIDENEQEEEDDDHDNNHLRNYRFRLQARPTQPQYTNSQRAVLKIRQIAYDQEQEEDDHQEEDLSSYEALQKLRKSTKPRLDTTDCHAVNNYASVLSTLSMMDTDHAY